MRSRSVPVVTALVASAFLSASLRSQVDADTLAKIRHEGLENSRAMDILDRLTHEIGHRLTGSDNFTRACEFARAEFASFGMTEVRLEPWDTWPITWNREQWMGRITAPEAFDLQVATPAWTNGTKGQVRGALIAMPESTAAIEETPDAYRGKFVFGRMPSDRSPQYRTLMAAGHAAGVLAFLESSAGDAANPNRIRVFGSRPFSPEIPNTPPHIVIRRDQAQKIREMMDAGQELLGEFEIRNRWRREPIELNNVIAEIVGTEKPDECVIVSAHLDSWHQATGTTDNGTGATSTLEAARILMAIGARPKRTIRFCLWGGEEQGLLGSLAYTTKHRAEMGKVSAVFNHDTGTNWAHGLTVTQAIEPLITPILAPVMALPSPDDPQSDEPSFVLRSAASIGGRGGSDDASFLRAGVPAFNWQLAGRSDYFSHTWHSQWDTYDEAIPEYMRHTSTVIAMTVLGVANLPDLLPRDGIGSGGGNQPQRPRGNMLGSALGMEMDADNPLLVKAITDGGAGKQAGFQAGDVVAKVGETAVGDARELSQAVRGALRAEGATKVVFVVKRGAGEAASSVAIEVPVAAFSRRE
ncbi:MAG: M20/M25/M40 family metallo-hydrolase [Planctomycetota bacterium]